MLRFIAFLTVSALTIPAAWAQKPTDSEFLKGFYWGVSVIDCPTNEKIESVLEGADSLPVKQGAFVLGVDPYGCAGKAGIIPFTVISAINGEKVASAADFNMITAGIKSGDKLVMRAHIPYERGRMIKWKAKTLKGVAKSRLESVKGQVTTTKDDVTGITTYRHKDDSEVINDQSRVELTIAHDGERYVPQLTIKYVAEDWLFIRDAKLMVGKEIIEIPLNANEFKHDNDTRIWEWVHLTPKSLDNSDELIQIIETLSQVLNAKIILSGQQYRKDRDLEGKELGRIREMWTYYRGLKEREIAPGD